tara:strand:- start:53 stop:295 length:243 start_codon:yes stop_codon:yes gene_type:complete
MVKKDKNKVKDIVDEFLKDKLGDTFHVDVKKKNLINDGLLDSLDILTLSSIIEKKTKRKINISDPKIFKKFHKYSDLIKI